MGAGGYKDVKDKLMKLIAASHSDLSPQSTHIFGDWRIKVWKFKKANMPIVTVRVAPVNINETAYGSQLSSTERGTYATFFFTAHVWEENASSGNKSDNALNLADSIVTYLTKYSGDTTSGIVFFRDVTYRDSQPETGPQRYSRVIIEGFIFAKRPFS